MVRLHEETTGLAPYQEARLLRLRATALGLRLQTTGSEEHVAPVFAEAELLHQFATRHDIDGQLSGALLLRASTRELGPTRDAVLETVVRRLDVSQKQAAEAYTLAEQHEPNPRSVWGYAQGLTRLSQRTPWQDGRYVLDRAASRLLATVH